MLAEILIKCSAVDAEKEIFLLKYWDCRIDYSNLETQLCGAIVKNIENCIFFK